MTILTEKGRVFSIVGDLWRDYGVILDDGRLVDSDIPTSTLDSRYD